MLLPDHLKPHRLLLKACVCALVVVHQDVPSSHYLQIRAASNALLLRTLEPAKTPPESGCNEALLATPPLYLLLMPGAPKVLSMKILMEREGHRPVCSELRLDSLRHCHCGPLELRVGGRKQVSYRAYASLRSG